MLSLANGFAERGVSVDLVLVRAEGPYLTDVKNSVNIVDLNATRVATSLPGLVRYLRSARPTALLSAMGHANVLAALALWLARVQSRLVVSEHLTSRVSGVKPTRARERLMPLLMRYSYGRADGVVAVSKGVADDLSAHIDFPREKIRVIYNPVVSEELLQQSTAPLDHPWFARGEPPVVLGVGRLTSQKDFATLIRAFANVCTQRPARLVILGEGEDRAELEALVDALNLHDFVALPGFVANPICYMRHAAVFALSSAWEGFGNVLVEAMACGTQVVATNCPSGPSEILENGRWGRMVPVGDVSQLAHAILQTLDDPHPPDVARRALDFRVDVAVDAYRDVLLPSVGFSSAFLQDGRALSSEQNYTGPLMDRS